MDTFFNSVIWLPNPDIFSISFLTVRWYGLLFALGFIIAQQIMFYIYKKEGKPQRDVESLTIYMIIAVVIGARLGHVLFYQPEVYFADPIKILKIWEGGLASHGAAVGILVAILLYVNFYINISFSKFKVKKRKRKDQSYLWVIDRIVIVVALAGCLIRLGNLINSEIVGKPTNSNWGFVFAWEAKQLLLNDNLIDEVGVTKPDHSSIETPGAAEGLVPLQFILKFVAGEGYYEEEDVRAYIENSIKQNLMYSYGEEHLEIARDQPLNYTLDQKGGHYIASVEVLGIARHPAQLYESIYYFLLFIALFLLWTKRKQHTPQGLIFGVFLIALFGIRFIVEFLKENQVAFEDDLLLNMGQWLSIPFIIAGIVLLIYVFKKRKHSHSPE